MQKVKESSFCDSAPLTGTARLVVTIHLHPAAASLAITLGDVLLWREFKGSMSPDSNPFKFVLRELVRGRQYVIEVTSLDAKGSVVDVTHIMTEVPEEENSITAYGISGTWKFEKPVVMGNIVPDSRAYGSMVIAPEKDRSGATHICLLREADGSFERRLGRLFWSSYDGSRTDLYTVNAESLPGGGFRTIGIEMNPVQTSLGTLAPHKLPVDLSGIVSPAFQPLDGQRARFAFCEYRIRTVRELRVPDESARLKQAIEEMLKLQKSLPETTLENRGEHLVVHNASCIYFWKERVSSYKSFGVRYSEKSPVSITLDAGEMYIYPVIAARVA